MDNLQLRYNITISPLHVGLHTSGPRWGEIVFCAFLSLHLSTHFDIFGKHCFTESSCCIASSYGPAIRCQVVDLVAEGASEYILDECRLPIQVYEWLVDIIWYSCIKCNINLFPSLHPPKPDPCLTPDDFTRQGIYM